MALRYLQTLSKRCKDTGPNEIRVQLMQILFANLDEHQLQAKQDTSKMWTSLGPHLRRVVCAGVEAANDDTRQLRGVGGAAAGAAGAGGRARWRPCMLQQPQLHHQSCAVDCSRRQKQQIPHVGPLSATQSAAYGVRRAAAQGQIRVRICPERRADYTQPSTCSRGRRRR